MPGLGPAGTLSVVPSASLIRQRPAAAGKLTHYLPGEPFGGCFFSLSGGFARTGEPGTEVSLTAPVSRCSSELSFGVAQLQHQFPPSLVREASYQL